MAVEERGRCIRIWAWMSFEAGGDVKGQKEGAGLHLQRCQQAAAAQVSPVSPASPLPQHQALLLVHQGMWGGVSSSLSPLHLFALHPGAAIQTGISPLPYEPGDHLKPFPDRGTLLRGCFDKLIVYP